MWYSPIAETIWRLYAPPPYSMEYYHSCGYPGVLKTIYFSYDENKSCCVLLAFAKHVTALPWKALPFEVVAIVSLQYSYVPDTGPPAGLLWCLRLSKKMNRAGVWCCCEV